jgi:Icc-related predicted phosphoesterase
MILGCGDLPYYYLEFLVSMLNIPLFYVPGNHDPKYNKLDPSSQAEGCDFLDRRIARVKGLNLAGLGGSIRYRPIPSNQYTQVEMYMRLISFVPSLLKQRIKNHGVLDVIIAHSPPYGIHDDNDPAHVGFLAFRDIIRIVKPRYFLHGHTREYKGNLLPAVAKLGTTTVINVNPYRLLEVEPYVR